MSEGGLTPDTGSESQHVVTKVENLVFRDQVPGDTVEYVPVTDDTFWDGHDDDCHLQEFLSRPVRIYTGAWAENGTQNVTINPWSLYFNDSSINKNCDNYGLIRCDLKVKIMINASPFFYGHLLASYKPLIPFNGGQIDETSDGRLISMSQRPHLWIYPQESRGGEMSLPFFYHKNWLRIGVLQDFVDMGQLNFSAGVPLRNSNGVTGDTIEYQVYAWASNVSMAAPTTGLALQAGDVPAKKKKGESKIRKDGKVSRSQGAGDVSYKAKTEHAPKMTVNSGSGGSDEYGKGPVSLVASAIASATGALSEVPVIGPYMTATSFVAKTAADVASYFGWSNPPVLSNIAPFKDLPFHGMACPEISTPVEKLTLDPKNELCIDSRTVGLDGTDELSIESIVTRESHLEYFTWTDTTAPQTLLYSIAVSPHNVKLFGNGIYAVPMAHIAQMFQYWRGDIIFRFQVICTQYHRGRLIISWDPMRNIVGEPNTETVTYSRVYDIAQDRDFELRIPYVQALAWLRNRNNFYSVQTATSNPAGVTTYSPELDNGVMTVRVLNGLTAPALPSTVSVAVSVRGAPNLSFASPKALSTQYSLFDIQSADVPSLDSQTVSDEEEKEIHNLGDPEDYVDKACLVYMGEAVKSLRPLLRRYSFHRNVQLDTDTATQWRQAVFKMGRYPIPFGLAPNGIYTSAAGAYNYTIVTPFEWLLNCFVGMRGSMNWRINISSKQYIDSMILVRKNGETRTSADFTRQYVGVGVTRDISARDDVVEGLNPSFAGGCLVNQKTQTGLEAQLPMYSPYRMVATNPGGLTLGNSFDGTNTDSVELQFRVNPSTGTDDANRTLVRYYTAVGTDFNFFFFLNVPVIYDVLVPSVA